MCVCERESESEREREREREHQKSHESDVVYVTFRMTYAEVS